MMSPIAAHEEVMAVKWLGGIFPEVVGMLPFQALQWLILENHCRWILAPSEVTGTQTACWDGIISYGETTLLALESAIQEWVKK